MQPNKNGRSDMPMSVMGGNDGDMGMDGDMSLGD